MTNPRKWLKFAGVLSEHIGAQRFQRVELVNPIPFALETLGRGPVIFRICFFLLVSPIYCLAQVVHVMRCQWCKNLGWADKIDKECMSQWLLLKPDLLSVSDFHIPRNNKIEGDGVIQFSLVCFCDASKSTYAAVVYLLQKNEVTSRSDLIFAKTRLAVIKQITIPRLELTAVLIGVHCVQCVKVQLGLPLANIYLWSDSQFILKWLCTAKSISVFVRNRVSEIKRLGHWLDTVYLPPGGIL